MAAFTVSEAFHEGWALTRPNLGKIWKFTGLVWAVSFGFNFIGLIVGKEASSVVSLLSMVITMVLSLSFLRIMLRLVDKKETKLDDLFWFEGKAIWAYFMASILYYLIICGGLLLLIIPGIIWAYMFMMYQYAIVDKEKGAVEALKYSRKLTTGNKGKLFGLMILILLMNMGAALLLLVGLIVTLPLTSMIMAWVYRRLTQAVEAPLDAIANS